MRDARNRRAALRALFATAAWVTSTGCTHNYYYGATPCGPTGAAPGTVEYGSVCDVPTQVVGGSTVASGSPAGPSSTLTGPRPPRIVTSEPSGGSRLAWRRADPESGPATTRVEGAVEDPTLTR